MNQNKDEYSQTQICGECSNEAKFKAPTEIVRKNGIKRLKVTFVCQNGHVTVKYITCKTK